MIINIIGIQANGKTTFCNIISKIDDKYNIKKLVVKDTDDFLNSNRHDVKYDIAKINEYIEKNKNKHIIFCGLPYFLNCLKKDLVKNIIIVDLKNEIAIKNCSYRFFSKKIVGLFFIVSYILYKNSMDLNCKQLSKMKLNNTIKINDNNKDIKMSDLKKLEEYKNYNIKVKTIEQINKVDFNDDIQTFNTNIVYYNSFDQLDDIILLILNKCEVKENITKENINKIIEEYISRTKIIYYFYFFLKFILLFIFYIPSYKRNKLFILFPLWTFFLPTFFILEVLNIVYFIHWIKKNKNNEKKTKYIKKRKKFKS